VPASLGLARTSQQERFADAFLLAVAAAAGCSTAKPDVDHDSIDWTLACKLAPRRPKIDFQMKSTVNANGTVTHLHFPLSRKNYDELIVTDVLVPRVLLVVLVPADIDHWLELTIEKLLLRNCAYWVSLRGLQPTKNEQSVTVYIPRSNLFNPDALQAMMTNANSGVPL
jgi:Domain of unknown function (DUF4365)